jgi:transcriptional regulator with XRE-family HTH domain
LGAQLRKLRLERDLSQERLAELSGLHYKYIGRVELAKSEPGADVLVRLARALRVPVGELFATVPSEEPGAQDRLAPADATRVGDALATLTELVDRVAGRPSRSVRARATRRPRR